MDKSIDVPSAPRGLAKFKQRLRACPKATRKATACRLACRATPGILIRIRISASNNTIAATIHISPGSYDIAAGEGAIWVSNAKENLVTRVDPASNLATATISVGLAPIEGAFIVNVGDLMEVWTNGEFVATSHRVRRVREERYSFAMFCTCDYYTVVEPLVAFIGLDRPPRYEPQIAGEHLFAQTAQSFSYLKRRLETGDLVLPASAKPLSSFGQEARQGKSSDFGVEG